MSDPESIVSPGQPKRVAEAHRRSSSLTPRDLLRSPSGGVGFDINCGVRLLRTNLVESDVAEVRSPLESTLWLPREC